MGGLCRPRPTNRLAHRLENLVSVHRDRKKHKLRKVVNSGTRLCSFILETRNIGVSEAPDQGYVLKTGNGKRGSLQMVTEFPTAGIIGSGLSVSTILLEVVLGDRPDDFVDVLPGLKLKWPKNTQIKRLKFISSFRRHSGAVHASRYSA